MKKFLQKDDEIKEPNLRFLAEKFENLKDEQHAIDQI